MSESDLNSISKNNRITFDPTITRRIRRMHFDEVEARRELARLVQVYLDAAEPDGKH